MPVMVTLLDPMMLNEEQVTEPAQEAVAVATVPSELFPVQYARLPITGADEVPTPR